MTRSFTRSRLAVGSHGWDRVRQSYFVAAGAGFMLAAVFLRLVPESYRLAEAHGEWRQSPQRRVG